ncbi:MAG: hypothetical protein K0R14_18 [Burkholderiales bacterium]|jgi:hypothetical protein|nr:hypothetical protein [Burkholderiales bacterium]
MYTTESNDIYKSISWGAIFFGTIVSLGLETLLNFLGIGLGLASLNQQNPHIFNFESGVIIWLAVSGMFSMGIGGWLAGKFSNIRCAFSRGCHGLAVWSLAIFITVMVAASTSGILMSGTISIIVSPQQIQNLSQNDAKFANPSVNNGIVPIPDEQIKSYADNMGRASIALFIAFFVSALASIMGAVWANFYKKDEKILQTE